MAINEPTILRHNRHCLQCRSIAYNCLAVGAVRIINEKLK